MNTNRTISRRTFVACALTALAGLGTSGEAFADYQASAETEAALASAQARYEAALTQIAYLNDQVFEAEAVYNDINDQLMATIAEIERLTAEIEQKKAELAAAQDVLAERIAAAYRTGNTEMLDLLLGASDFDDLATRIYYANKLSDSDAAVIETVKTLKAQLEADEAAMREQQAYQEQLLAQQAAQIEYLNQQVANAEAYASSLDGEVQALIAQRDAEIAAQAEAARQAAAAEAAAAAAQAAASSGGSSGGGSSSSGGGGGYSGGGSTAGVVSAGYNYIGTPYSVLDCSGFTSAAYADCGISLYHQSGVQYNTVCSKGNLVGAGGLAPGNLVFYARGGSIYHVGLYIGSGMIIDSIPNGGVQVRSLYFCDGFCGGGSPI